MYALGKNTIKSNFRNLNLVALGRGEFQKTAVSQQRFAAMR